jgi:hypothetical protein
MANTTYRPIRWTLSAIAREFSLSIPTVKTKLGTIQPGDDDCFSTEQVIEAIFDSFSVEKSKTEKVRRRLLELKVERFEASVVPIDDVKRALSEIVVEIVQIIRGSNLSRRDQNDVLSSIARADEVLRRIQRETQDAYGDFRKQKDSEVENESSE